MADSRDGGGAVRRLAPAKVNLALHVTGRRPDLYHEIDTLAVFADVGDSVTVTPAETIELSVGGPLAGHAPAGPDNLAWRAASLLREATGREGGARIHVDKLVPAGAGLGGGSADAAATLLALNELWRTRLSRQQLAGIGLKLGADLPMCLHGRPLRARGIGEAIAPLASLPPLPLVLVWPGEALETGRVFAALESRENPPLAEPPAGLAGVAEVGYWLAACRNDLEAPAIRLALSVAEALKALRATEGCLLARLSGSGSACFGLFATTDEAAAAAATIAAAQPAWWVRATAAR